MNTVTKRGNELRVGDTIQVWWHREDRGQERNPTNGTPIDVITKILPYEGPLNRYFKDGARIAIFNGCRIGMTIPNNEIYEVVI